MIFFKTDAELKDYLPTTAGFKLQQLQPSLTRALSHYLLEAVGRDQLQILAAAYEAGTLDDAQTALLAAVRLPLASFAAGYYGNGTGVQLGATGPVQSESQTLKPASAPALAGMASSNEAAGFESLEALLELLEENREDYPLWVASDACTVLAGQLLATAKEFDRFVFIDRSRRRFLELQPSVRDVERLAVQPLMGVAQLTELRTQLAAGTVTDSNGLLLSFVRPAVANLAIKGDDDRQATGSAYLDELRAFLYDRADDYPLFKSSTAYQPDVAVQLQQNADWGFYAGF